MTARQLSKIRDIVNERMAQTTDIFNYYRKQKEDLYLTTSEAPTEEELESMEKIDKMIEKYGKRQYELQDIIQAIDNVEVLTRVGA